MNNSIKFYVHLVIISVVSIIFLPFVDNAFSNSDDPLGNLVPEPQKIVQLKNAEEVRIDDEWQIVVCNEEMPHNDDFKVMNPYLSAAMHLKQYILKTYNFNIMIINSTDTSYNSKKNKRIYLGNYFKCCFVKDEIKKTLSQLNGLPYETDDRRYGEAYVLEVKSDRIVIASHGAAGVYYGVQTLNQIIAKKFLKEMLIVDYPDLAWRGAYLNIYDLKDKQGKRIGPCLTESAAKTISIKINEYSKLKLNTIIFRSTCFNFIDDKNNYYLKKLFDECRKVHIMPIPTIYSKLTSGFVFPPYNNNKCGPKVDLRNTEGWNVQNELFYFDDNGVAQPMIPFRNVITNASFEKDFNRDGVSGSWSIRNNYLGDDCKVVNDSSFIIRGKELIHTGNKAIKFERKDDTIDSSSILSPLDEKTQKPYLSVEPDSYYELIFFSRSEKGQKAKLRIDVKQYDSNEYKLDKYTRRWMDYQLVGDKWKCEHLSIFTNKACNKLKIKFLLNPKSAVNTNVYLDDVHLIRMDSALRNVINPVNKKNGNDPKSYGLKNINVMNLDGTFTYEEGRDYQIKPGKLTIKPEELLNDTIKAILSTSHDSRIKVDQKVRLSYDCLVLKPNKGGMAYCPSSPDTYRYYKTLFKNLTILEPKYINIEYDEHWGAYNRDSRCLSRHADNAQIVAGFLNGLNHILRYNKEQEILKGFQIKGLGRSEIQLIVWDDMLNYWHNGGGERGDGYQIKYGGITGETYLAMPDTPVEEDHRNKYKKGLIPNVSKDIIMACWWYHDNLKKQIKKSIDFYKKRKFQFFGVGYSKTENIKFWSKSLFESRALGLMNTMWTQNGKTDDKGVIPTANYAWKADR